MVLSNKKLKQKLRAEKAELLAASEAQLGASTNNFKNSDHSNSNALQSLKPVESVGKEPRSSKRGKRRKKAPSLQENDGNLNGDGGGNEKPEKGEEGSEKVGKDKKKTKKRKRDEGNQGLEDEKVKKVKKLKRKTKKRKGKKKEDNEKVKDGMLSVDDAKVDGQGVTETANTGISEGSINVSTKVYVGGIPYYSTEDDIRSYFESCGTITEIDCMKFPESGKFRGIAIMNFKTEAAAKRALALDGSDMGGFFLKIQPYKPTRLDKTSKFSPTVMEGYNRIYVGNLSWDITDDDLRKLFSGCSITSIRFGEDKATGEFRGYAHVDFTDSNSLNLALKLDQNVVCGRPVRISCAVPKKGSNNNIISVPVPEKNEAVDDVVPAVSGKIRRRTCYECGERGHLSSSCPKKQAVEQTTTTTS